MSTLVRSALRRLRERPLGETLSSGLRFAAGMARARFYLRDCDAAHDARVDGRVRVDNRGDVTIGPKAHLVGRWNPVELITGPHGKIEIGARSFVNFGTSIRAEGRVAIGEEAMLGQYCILSDVEFPDAFFEDGLRSDPPSVDPRPIVVGKRAWLAGRVTVLPGVTIGDGAVVAAGSIVETDIPPHTLAGGIPARVIRKLADTSKASSAASSGGDDGDAVNKPDGR